MFSGVRWLIVSLLFVAGLINYMDRSAMSVAAPLVSKDLHLDPAQLGFVFSIFFFGTRRSASSAVTSPTGSGRSACSGLPWPDGRSSAG